MGNPTIYAVYRGDRNIADGTTNELAQKLGINKYTVYKWASKSHRNSIKEDGNAIFAIKLGRKKEIDRE
ncbi:hypothetical protein [Phocoenobacter skyensis]|uniref:Uncharacterized protein n=1 Tax=Phocoenobacter skyensis TaxID=97481 RepID=A0ABT9JKU0_9PAST|nr:hypothetical protein [Pasteurella skyensis]MDP8079546.1 hypothetical protein [Pasteurella skyensis]MDP8085418.1 hypothetical protein [Pasteurella skyensis]